MLILPLSVALSALCAGARAQESGSSFPFEITSNKPFVQVHVSGRGPFWFVLDTGAENRSFIGWQLARQLGISIASPQEMHIGAEEGVTVNIGLAPGLSLDVHGIRHRGRHGVLELQHMNPYVGRPIQGLLGADFLENRVVTLDYQNRRITVRDPTGFRPSGTGTTVPLSSEQGWAIASASVQVPGCGPIKARLHIDTGMRQGILFKTPFVKKHHLDEALAQAPRATVGGSLGGPTRGLVARIDWIKMGDIEIVQPIAVLSLDRTGNLAAGDVDGILGGMILRRFTVTFDYPHQRMILEPNARARDRFEHDMSGMFLIAQGDEFERITVQSVMRDSPAAAAGVRRGDQLATIDGRKASKLGLAAIRLLFMQPNRSCHIVFSRGTSRFEATLKLKRLL